MGTLEDVRNMQESGKTDSEIIRSLREKGVSAKEISEALAQTKIKAAVSDSETDEELGIPSLAQPMQKIGQQRTNQRTAITEPAQQMQAGENQFAGMQQSIMTAEMTQENAEAGGIEAQQQMYQQPEQLYVPPEQAEQGYAQGYAEQGYGYEQYQPTGISADTITEIAEQIVSERLTDIRKELEKVLDFRTTIDAKIEYVDERLKRIERVLDRLQLSILQKVGEYATDVSDLKNELVETQKSFKAVTQGRRGGK